MKRYIVKARTHIVDGKMVLGLELYDDEYYWKNVSGKEYNALGTICGLVVKGDEIVYFDPDERLTPEGAITLYDENL